MRMPVGEIVHCPTCSANGVMRAEQCVYAVGRIEIRFQTLALERKFRRQAHAADGQGHALGRARAVCDWCKYA